MYTSILLALPLLSIALSQDDGIGGCQSGSITGNRCCDGDVISTDGAGIDTSDISNLVCCVGGSGSGFSFGGTSCASDQTSVAFSELSTADGASQGSTVIVSNDNTMIQVMTTTGNMESSATSSASVEETAMNSSGMTDSVSGSQTAEESSTDTSTGAAVLMTSGPMAGALLMAGGFAIAAL